MAARATCRSVLLKAENSRPCLTFKKVLTAGLCAAAAVGTGGVSAQAYQRDLFIDPQHPHAMDKLDRRYDGIKKTCVVDLHMPHDKNFANLTVVNHEAYAREHGYSYLGFTGRISGPLFINTARGPLNDRYGGGLTWQKLSAMAAVSDLLLPNGFPQCETLLWTDTDAIFTNFNIPIDGIVHRFTDDAPVPKDVILTREHSDYSDSFVNSGVWIIKNTWGGRAFLEGVAKLYPYHKEGPLTDQNAIQEYAFGRDPRGHDMSERAVIESGLRQEIVLVPQRVLNSFRWVGSGHEPYSLPGSEWMPCDFVGHAAGLSFEQRIDGLTHMLSTVDDC